MTIKVKLSHLLADRGLTAREVAARVNITEANLSLLRSGKVKGIRFATLAALCDVLDCQPGDLLRHEPEPGSGSTPAENP
ncbi:helix-turn-helix domain-containing protein [Yunchengibacter salinarum]|uniref:helix-turn-helix domain-containing protein n=1 Tax=Yunchengibacter salinarum TaxID=3133399 RepID=UPI0035B5E99C